VDNSDYVGEAAEALAAPAEIWLFRDDFFYDQVSREWRFQGSDFPGLRLAGEVRDWLLRICDWLQGNYPAGPVSLAADRIAGEGGLGPCPRS
jgi:hypothetical protein